MAQWVEHITSPKEVMGLIPILAVRSLLAGSVSVLWQYVVMSGTSLVILPQGSLVAHCGC